MVGRKEGVIIVLICLVLVGVSLYYINLLNDKYEQVRAKSQRLNSSLRERRGELNNLQDKYNKTVERYQGKVLGLNKTVSSLNWAVDQLKERKNKLRGKLERKETYHIPTPEEVENIVLDSDIDEREYVDGEYVCSEYSFDLVEEFKEQGIFSCPVEINFGNSAHYLVGVNTTKGIRYVESESDVIFDEMEIGDDYCNIVGWDCDWEDEITKISSCFGILKVN